MLDLNTFLVFSITKGDRHITLPQAQHQQVAQWLDANQLALVLEIHAEGRSEIVRAVGYDTTTIIVERGARGTPAQMWLAGSCLCSIDTEPLCASTDPNCDPCNPPNPWDTVVVGEGLEIDRTDPNNPVLRMRRTGVVPGNYGGAEVNERGQFVSIPPGWPASALPLFDPCCNNTGGGDAATNAGDVSYSPCGFVGGTNVQDAICQLEQWAAGLSFDAGVTTVTAGDGIVVSGTTTQPVVALQPVGISPGVYGGFEINEFGQVLNFTPTTVDHPTHAAVAPLRVTYDAGTNTWTHTVDWADYTQPGVVQFVSVSDIQNDTVPAAQEEWAITYEGAAALVQRELNNLGVANFDISALPVAANVQSTDDLAIYNYTSGQHERISLGDIAEFVGATTVLLEYDPATAATGANKGVSSVTVNGIGDFTVTLASPPTNPVISARVRGDLPLAVVTVTFATATTLTVKTYNLEVVGGTLQATPTDHPFYLLVHEDN